MLAFPTELILVQARRKSVSVSAQKKLWLNTNSLFSTSHFKKSCKRYCATSLISLINAVNCGISQVSMISCMVVSFRNPVLQETVAFVKT